MFRKLLISGSLFLLLTTPVLVGQIKSAFTGDVTTFRTELTDFMGPNLKAEQKNNLEKFFTRWDSTTFSRSNKNMIADIASQLSARMLRPVPHFYDFIITINSFVDFKRDDAVFTSWLRGLSEIAFNPRISSDNITRYFRNTGSMIKDNVLSESGSVKWKVKGSKLQFEHDTAFSVGISNATLTCYSQTDSTEIYNVTGVYYPEIQQFIGKKGTVTWEKAGYQKKDLFAEITDYQNKHREKQLHD